MPNTTLAKRLHGFVVSVLAVPLLGSLVHGQVPTYYEKVGYDKLLAELGPSIATGDGVVTAIVEATRNGGYIPNVSGKTINVLPSPNGIPVANSGHATSAGNRFFGTASTSPDVDNIDSIHADDFLDSLYGAGKPTPHPYQVSNHSYIFSTNADFNLLDARELLTRLDHSIAAGDSTVVVGTQNGRFRNDGTPKPLPVGHAHAYNVLTVGVSDGDHAGAPSTFYGPDGSSGVGRTKIEIVAPEGSTSNATPCVASAAALLHESGAGTDAIHTQTMKAILLAGATKHESLFDGTWDKTATRPLDEHFGAGELNVYNSFKIQQGGEQEGSTGSTGSPVASLGWDYESSFDPTEDQYYQFTIGAGEENNELSVILNWNINVQNASASPTGFVPFTQLADFNLELTNLSGTVIDTSASTVDNIEHIYAQDLAAGVYTLKVSGDRNEAYGLAWRFTAIPEPGGAILLTLGFAGTLLHRRRRKPLGVLSNY